MTPTRLYPAVCLPLIQKLGEKIHGLVHITGGGFYDNIPRALPENLGAEIELSWEIPVIFKLLRDWGNVDWREMFRTFNCGVGMVLIVDRDAVAEIDCDFYEIGRVVEGAGVTIRGGVFND